jgi:hypothetical protein
MNENGLYAVNLYIRGKPWTIILDDIFLFDNET